MLGLKLNHVSKRGPCKLWMITYMKCTDKKSDKVSWYPSRWPTKFDGYVTKAYLDDDVIFIKTNNL